VITGLFSRLAGTKQNVPIVRTGNLAMMPGEKVPTTFGEIDAYLIEARSIGGLSGSPVFVRETHSIAIQRENIGTVPLTGIGAHFLLGVIHGHWDLPPGAAIDATADQGSINMGIAIVTPATMLLEVLAQPALEAMRQEAAERFKREKAPTAD